MDVTVNFDSIDGESKSFTTYEIDWDAFTSMPLYNEIYNATHNLDDISTPVKCIAFYQSSGDFGSAIPNLPTDETDSNTLNNYANTFTFTSNEYYADYLSNPENYEQMTIGTKPDDWDTNPHYMFLLNAPSPRDDHRVNIMCPVSVNEPWNNFMTYYLDKTKKIVQRICLKNGYVFTTSKGYVSPSVGATSYKASICGGAYTYEPFVESEPYKFFQVNYAISHNNATTHEYEVSPMAMPTQSSIFPSRSNLHGVNLRSIADTTITYCVFISTTIGTEKYIGLASIVYNTDTHIFSDIGGFLISENFWDENLKPFPPEEGEWGDNTEPNVPHGNFDVSSDNYGDDSGISTGARVAYVTAGIMDLFASGIYNPYVINYQNTKTTPASVWNLSYFNVMFSELFSSEYMTRYSTSFFNPLSAVLAFHLIPSEFVHFQTSGTPATVVKRDLTLNGYNISLAYRDHHSGTTVDTKYRMAIPLATYHVGSYDFSDSKTFRYDQFLDFTPYTKCYLHLPFIGKVELNVNQIMYGKISVDYTCDVISGNVIANIWCKDYMGHNQFIHTASGNCAYSIPLFSSSQDGSSTGKLIASITSLALTGASAAAGNLVGMVSGLGSSIANAVDAYNAHNTSSTVISGEIGGNNTLISPLDCFLEIIHPRWTESMHYKKLRGIPSQMSNTIANSAQTTGSTGYPYDGYIEITNIELDSISATESEKAEIAELLAKGVHIRGEELLE